MKILILGGTLFLGRHLVAAARSRGHEVTLFHRGRTNPGLFQDVERLRGDRDGDLEALKGRRWDAAIDTSGYVPRVVRASSELLAESVGHYTFVSSGSVYADSAAMGIVETAPVATLSREGTENVAEEYGALKALCERAAGEAMRGRSLAVRFGLLVGPHDPTGRFTYWPRRLSRGGEVLAPGRPLRQIQFIDARDGADWILRMAEAGRTGAFNVTGPPSLLTMERFLETTRAAIACDARLLWVEESFLLAHEVAPWTELPLWLPEEMDGMLAVNIQKALGAGLTFRPLAETVRDTLAWDLSRPVEERARPVRMSSGLETAVGLDPAREAELLAAWRARPMA